MNPLAMTIREVFDELYDKTDLTQGTLDRFDYVIRRWERLTDNPTIENIDLQVMQNFKSVLVDLEYAPSTINSTLRTMKAILRLLGPQQYRNPFGMGVIERVPIVKSLKEPHTKPKRITLAELGKLYDHLHDAQFPRKWVSPSDWWRCLLVLAYCTGLRRCDILSLTHDDIDLDKQTISFVSQKTGKSDTYRLHPSAVYHLRKIWEPITPERSRLFNEYSANNSGSFYPEWHRCRREAGIDRFTLHDVRRSAASEIARIGGVGLASRFLQHAPRSVTEVFYVNMDPELNQAILKLRVPKSWNCGELKSKAKRGIRNCKR